MKKIVSFCLSAAFLTGILFSGNPVSATRGLSSTAAETETGDNSTFDYYKYSQKYVSLSGASKEIVLDGADYAVSTGKVSKLEQYQGADRVVKIETADEETSVSWDIDIPTPSKYQIQIKYYSMKNRGSNIE